MHPLLSAEGEEVRWGGGGGRGLNLQPNFQKSGGLDRTSTFRGGCWERGGDFDQGVVAIFTQKKLKSEIFNYKKKVYKQK